MIDSKSEFVRKQIVDLSKLDLNEIEDILNDDFMNFGIISKTICDNRIYSNFIALNDLFTEIKGIIDLQRGDFKFKVDFQRIQNKPQYYQSDIVESSKWG